jgi:hypothetical protein
VRGAQQFGSYPDGRGAESFHLRRDIAHDVSEASGVARPGNTALIQLDTLACFSSAAETSTRHDMIDRILAYFDASPLETLGAAFAVGALVGAIGVAVLF